MPQDLNYESGLDRAKEVRARRRTIWKRAGIGIGIGLAIVCIPIFVLISWAMYHDSHITVHTNVKFTNNSGFPVTDAGFYSIIEDRVGSMGPVPVGQTVQKTFIYKPDECPCDFVFEQSGQTYYVSLPGPNVDDQTAYEITVAPGKLTAVLTIRRGPTTTYIQTPTTRPIKYLK